MLSTLDDVENAKWMTLTEGEEIVAKMNPHPIEYLLPVVAGVTITGVWLIVAMIVPLLPWWSAAAGAVMGVAVIVMAHLRRITTVYVFTTSEIYKRYGVFDEDFTQIRIDKVQNTSVDLSWFERFIGYGDITIYTSGSGTQDMYISNIPDPRAINKQIAEMMEEVGKSAGKKQTEKGKQLQWVPEDDNAGYD